MGYFAKENKGEASCLGRPEFKIMENLIHKKCLDLLDWTGPL
jgi:hypothetical protein